MDAALVRDNRARKSPGTAKISSDASGPFMLDATLQSSLSNVVFGVRENPNRLLAENILEKLSAHLNISSFPEAEALALVKDNDPATVACQLGRMLSLFFEKFLKKNKGVDSQLALNEYLVTALHAVNEGFCETKEILSAFGSISEHFERNLDRIYSSLLDEMDASLEAMGLDVAKTLD
ncbi:MAG: hypothetical protein G3M78_01720 [Candidatus Nitrohelix vancouverensis]|uniref:DUF5610 domain-containing protein n=1 Tax=Candidatus Nitrohelix vancouverensis TaxID=2705534 RepID=A0A7T0G2C5_9BACT|nr:MAG: hypothetical protein G3M78_01720 [Candidatus Nitrohelix vancouverensis]